MTTQAAEAFVERLKSDEAFRVKVAGLGSPAERLALAREEGFDLTVEDGPAVKRELGIENLSDDELEQVVGGIFSPLPDGSVGSSSVIII